MILLAIGIQALAFYCMYNTSRRAVLPKDKLSLWLQRHRPFSTIAGLALGIISMAVFVLAKGIATGVFAAVLSVMTLGSLTIILTPITVNKNAGKR